MFVGAAVMTEGKSQYQWGVYGSYCQNVLKTLGVQQQRTAHNGQCVHPHQQTKKINKKKLELVPGVATALNAQRVKDSFFFHPSAPVLPLLAYWTPMHSSVYSIVILAYRPLL